MLTAYQKEFLKTIIGIPSVGGTAEAGAPYGKKAREVLDAFLAEAERNGFRTGTAGDRVGWVEFGEGDISCRVSNTKTMTRCSLGSASRARMN